MKLYILILFLLSGQFASAQTIIKLKSPAHNQEEYQFTNPSDTTFIEVGHKEDMGTWYGRYYRLKTNIPDGEYNLYVDDTLQLKAFIKNFQRSGPWTYFYNNGQIKKTDTYSNGKLESKKQITQETSDSINSPKFDCNEIQPGTYHVTSGTCADLVLNKDGTCYFKKTSHKKKLVGTWKVSHCTLFLSFDAVRKKSPIESVVGKNGKQVKKVKYKMPMNYKIHNGTLTAKEKYEENYNCGVYTLQVE